MSNKKLVISIHFVILPIADTNIFGRYSWYTDSWYDYRCNITNNHYIL